VTNTARLSRTTGSDDPTSRLGEKGSPVSLP